MADSDNSFEDGELSSEEEESLASLSETEEDPDRVSDEVLSTLGRRYLQDAQILKSNIL